MAHTREFAYEEFAAHFLQGKAYAVSLSGMWIILSIFGDVSHDVSCCHLSSCNLCQAYGPTLG